MGSSEQGSRVTPGAVLGVAGVVVGFGGYVLLVGAGVAWLNVHDLGVPPLGVVADIPRNELFGLGLEALLTWLVLVGAFALVVTLIGRTADRAPWAELALLVLATIAGADATLITQIESVGLLLGASIVSVLTIVALVAILGLRYEVASHRRPAVIAVLGGVLLGWAMAELLLANGRLFGFLVAPFAVGAAVWSAVELVLRRVLRDQDTVEQERIRELGGHMFQTPHRESEQTARAKRRRHAFSRLFAALAMLALLLAAGAVSSRSSRLFWAARVTTSDGSCVSGTLLVRNGEEVLLAGKPGKTADGRSENRLVEIPSSRVASVQVIGPPERPRRIKAEGCSHAGEVAHPGPFAPYPLVPGGETPEGEPRVQVVHGANAEVLRGPRGFKGEAGPTGVRGPTGEAGARGERGQTGEKGQTGGRGPSGERGPRGERGHTGVTGSRGPRGAIGPRGPRGERGPTAIDDR
jgi:hypothetical protein